jgi:hypothetical protein
MNTTFKNLEKFLVCVFQWRHPDRYIEFIRPIVESYEFDVVDDCIGMMSAGFSSITDAQTLYPYKLSSDQKICMEQLIYLSNIDVELFYLKNEILCINPQPESIRKFISQTRSKYGVHFLFGKGPNKPGYSPIFKFIEK